MKIILFIDSLAGGGSQRQLVNLAIGLQQRNHTITVATYAAIETHLPRLERASVEYHCVGKSGRFDLSPAWQLAKMVRRQKADMVVAFLRTPCVYAQLAKLLAPHARLIVSERAGLLNGRLRRSDKLASLGHLLASHVTANSHAFLDGLTRFMPPLKRKASVIYNGIDNRFFNAGIRRAEKEKACRNVAVIEKQNPLPTRLCVVAARPGEEKGLCQLIEAMQIVARNTTGPLPFRLDWIGPAGTHEPLVEQANALLEKYRLQKYWHWAGPSDNIVAAYENHDALVLPSLHEGVPNVLCEAMACGLPVVASNIADNARIVTHGTQGYLCEPDNPESLAGALHSLLELSAGERQQMGQRAHVRATQLFPMPQYIDNWEALLKRTA